MSKRKAPRAKKARGAKPKRRQISKQAREIAAGEFPTKKRFPNPPPRKMTTNLSGTREDISYFVEVGQSIDLIAEREWRDLRNKCLRLFKKLKKEGCAMVSVLAQTVVASAGSFVDGNEVFGSDAEGDWGDTDGWIDMYIASTPVTPSAAYLYAYFEERIHDRLKHFEAPKTVFLKGLSVFGFRFTGKSNIVRLAKSKT